LHVLAVLVGAGTALGVTAHIVRTLVVPRGRPAFLSHLVDAAVDTVFRSLARLCQTYEGKDRALASQGAVVILAQLATWLLAYELGYALVLWPSVASLPAALGEIASSTFTLGFAHTAGAVPTTVDVLAAATGIVVVALQIAYLPTLYSAFNRRETEVTLLGARAGMPPWGPELLFRTRYGVAVRSDDLPELYSRWERWAADVAESHSNYPVLVRFRSPQALSSWLVGLLAVMDSAAMLLALRPTRDRIEPRRALRMGFTALREIGAALGTGVGQDPDPDADILLGFEEFSSAVDELRAVGFPMDRDAKEAWPHFKGWRVNYEALAYELARRTDAVPAPWSGPRRWAGPAIPVHRPPNRSPGRPPGPPSGPPSGVGPPALEGKRAGTV
jgi:small basic protein